MKKDMAMLELLICTLNEGIRRVPDMLLPERNDVRYLVSWQQTGTVQVDLPEALLPEKRGDVRVLTLQGRGLSANRNHALKHATGDILLLADDDARYNHESFDTILRTFSRYPKADFICFRAVDRDGNFIKRYAENPYTYAKRPKGTHISSIEIAFRRQLNLPLFDERFGLGSKYLACGEEEIFLHDAISRGLKIIYLPEIIVETNPNTTGKRFRTLAAVRRSKGAVLCYLHGPVQAAARCLKYAATLGNGVTARQRLHFYKDMLVGIKYIQTGHI